MNGRIAKRIRMRAKAIAKKEGREIMPTQYNIHGEVVTPNEIRQIKKHYTRNK